VSKKNLKTQSLTDWQRIDAMMDEDIDLSDIPELDDSFFKEATLVLPKPKTVVTLRVDADVLQWFKARGKGYQTLMNAVLKEYSRHSTEDLPNMKKILKKEKGILQ
jgi:uncharacterized protein (DUF4415 family)